ncbi:DNA methyltransferase [Epilithonimonas caeni]|uniref:DNA methyltransferase n=1 Tax=Epilithonimonas caeni TaxID=365343 RepID=UPI00040E3324|nr:DNA methyltransferase [Epilithonimonas caeni]
MKNLKTTAKVALAPSTRKVDVIPTNLIEIPEEWNQLFTEEREEFIGELRKKIEKSKFYTPIIVFFCDGKYIIIDGVLRFKAIQRLGLDQIDCFVLDIEPQSADEVKDLIIEYKLRSEIDSKEIQKMIYHYLRIGHEKTINDETLNKRILYLAEILGKGWSRSNLFFFLALLKWEKKYPENHLQMSSKVLSGDLTINKTNEIRKILDDEFRPYTLDNDLESGILEKYINGEIRFLKDVIKLIDSYLNKTEERFTPLNIPDVISADRYQVFHNDARKMIFPEETKIHGIFTSPPYYKQIRYSKPEDPEYDNELGWEETPEKYVDNVVSIIKKGAEVMDDKGVIMININETFLNGHCVGIIPMYINEMKKDFHYIQTCIWVKQDAKPQPDKVKRFMNTMEYVLIFSKSKTYNFNKFKLNNPNKTASASKGCSEQSKNGKKTSGLHITNPNDQCRDFMFENDFADYILLNQSSGRSQDHNLATDFFGSFPTTLPIPFIMSFIPENTTVWDPFGGTGTTGRTVLSLNRKVIITELLGKNIPNVVSMLEKGSLEYNEETYNQFKDDADYQEGIVGEAA